MYFCISKPIHRFITHTSIDSVVHSYVHPSTCIILLQGLNALHVAYSVGGHVFADHVISDQLVVMPGNTQALSLIFHSMKELC